MSVQTEQTITSLEVAELTGKQHTHIMRDIRNILSQIDEINQSNFGLVKYTDTKGEERPMFNLTKEGCLCLVSGYDANLRMKIIDRWEELELQNQPQVPQTFSSAQTEQTITSLEVAELTGKQHKHIMRDIRNLLDKGVGAHNFVDWSYKDAQNQERDTTLLVRGQI